MKFISTVALIALAAGNNASAQARYVLAPAPTAAIGKEGDPAYEFGNIAGATRIADGRIVVADGSTLEIRLFDSLGIHLGSFGQRGAGPTEFQHMDWVGTSGDTVFLYDAVLRRVTTVVASGSRPRLTSQSMPAIAGSFYPLARLTSGMLVGMPLPAVSMRHRDGTFRDTVAVQTLESFAALSVTTVGRFPGLTYLAINPTNRERATAVGAFPLGPRLHVAAAGNLIAIADSDVGEVRFYRPGRAPAAIVRLPWSERTFSAVHVSQARAREIETASERSRAVIEARYDAKYRPGREPFISRMIPGPSRTVWVERFRVGAAGDAEVLMVDSTGVLGSVVIPPNFEILCATDTHIVGRGEDRDGRVTITIYRYHRVR